jgi:hypothetical protein
MEEEISIEEALRIRATVNAIKCRNKRSILQNILSGCYDHLGDEAQAIAKEDLDFVTNPN